MGVLGRIVFGLVVGIVAKFLMPGRDPGGFVVTGVTRHRGVAAGRVSRPGVGAVSGRGDAAGFLMAVPGAIIVLAVYRLLARRARPLVAARPPTPFEARTLVIQLAQRMSSTEVQLARGPAA
jgi:uncharacterized membrane protein YeaQ/YmgE (transglycosylase-associated protein family)